MSPRRSVGRDAPGTATRRKVRRARAPHGRRHATASHRGRHDRLAVRTARARAAQPQRRTAWDAASAGYGTGSRVEYRLVPRVFGLGGPLVALVGTTMGAGQRDRAKASHCLILAAGLRTKGSCCDRFDGSTLECNSAVAQALSTTSLAELVRGGGYISPKCSRHGHV